MLHTENDAVCVCMCVCVGVCYDKCHSFFCEICWYIWSHATERKRWFL